MEREAERRFIAEKHLPRTSNSEKENMCFRERECDCEFDF